MVDAKLRTYILILRRRSGNSGCCPTKHQYIAGRVEFKSISILKAGTNNDNADAAAEAIE